MRGEVFGAEAAVDVERQFMLPTGDVAGRCREDEPRVGTECFFVSEGFAQMLNNSLTILAANAIGAEKLSETDAQAELNSLNARRTEGLSGADLDRFNKDKQRAEAKLHAARTFKAQGGF